MQNDKRKKVKIHSAYLKIIHTIETAFHEFLNFIQQNSVIIKRMSPVQSHLIRISNYCFCTPSAKQRSGFQKNHTLIYLMKLVRILFETREKKN